MTQEIKDALAQCQKDITLSANVPFREGCKNFLELIRLVVEKIDNATL